MDISLKAAPVHRCECAPADAGCLQPLLTLLQAAGSSLLARLTNLLAADALRLAGLADLGPVTVLPMATGMAMTLTLLALKAQHRRQTGRYVVWPRIDQKTCLKAITAAGLEPVVVPMRQQGDELVTDAEAVASCVDRLGTDSIVCVATTTSCFAPRAADDVVAVAALCRSRGESKAAERTLSEEVVCKQAPTMCKTVVANAWGLMPQPLALSLQAARQPLHVHVPLQPAAAHVLSLGCIKAFEADHWVKSRHPPHDQQCLWHPEYGALPPDHHSLEEGASGCRGAEHRQELHGASRRSNCCRALLESINC